MLENISVITSPVGKIGIGIADNKLVSIKMLPDSTRLKSPNTPLSEKVANELNQYFKNPKHKFKLTPHLIGTPFQLNVWNALLDIASGTTLSYGQLAKQLKTSPRAIGQACRTNPITIIVPCHRIVASNHIGGYAGNVTGDWLEIKKWLLGHEGIM